MVHLYSQPLVSGGSLSLEDAAAGGESFDILEAETEAVGELEAEALGGNDKVSGFISSVAATALSELNSGGVAA